MTAKGYIRKPDKCSDCGSKEFRYCGVDNEYLGCSFKSPMVIYQCRKCLEEIRHSLDCIIK